MGEYRIFPLRDVSIVEYPRIGPYIPAINKYVYFRNKLTILELILFILFCSFSRLTNNGEFDSRTALRRFSCIFTREFKLTYVICEFCFCPHELHSRTAGRSHYNLWSRSV